MITIKAPYDAVPYWAVVIVKDETDSIPTPVICHRSKGTPAVYFNESNANRKRDWYAAKHPDSVYEVWPLHSMEFHFDRPDGKTKWHAGTNIAGENADDVHEAVDYEDARLWLIAQVQQDLEEQSRHADEDPKDPSIKELIDELVVASATIGNMDQNVQFSVQAGVRVFWIGRVGTEWRGRQ